MRGRRRDLLGRLEFASSSLSIPSDTNQKESRGAQFIFIWDDDCQRKLSTPSNAMREGDEVSLADLNKFASSSLSIPSDMNQKESRGSQFIFIWDDDCQRKLLTPSNAMRSFGS
ncbi:hypothetical protein L6164_019685 [Bauhinia variegata]|uniref:Uncharacterized protein n=1 Tax=Bauhinia variegata TaxID=167791 RepID=A0ACB9MTE9_BAUVA|nr:hypothetical protein L6164_019685 [Bauhinia variegata]